MKFKNVETGRIEILKNIDGAMAEMANGERIALQKLKDPRYYEEYVANSSQINNPSTQNMNESMVIDNNMNTNIQIGNDNNRYSKMLADMSQKKNSDISITPENDYREELAYSQHSENNPDTAIKYSGSVVESHDQHNRKMGIKEKVNTPKQPTYLQSRMSVSGELTPEQKKAQEEEILRKYGSQTNTQPNNPQQNVTGKTLAEIERGETAQPQNVTGKTLADIEAEANNRYVKPNQVQENPIHKVFGKAKKVHSLNVTLKINEKIPDKEVIKMLEQNFDESAIDYYASDIYNKLMKDPKIIEDQVKEAIKKYVKGRSKK